MTIAFNHLGKLGQLGNQMFQFAAGYSIAKRKNVNLIMDLSWLNSRNLLRKQRMLRRRS